MSTQKLLKLRLPPRTALSIQLRNVPRRQKHHLTSSGGGLLQNQATRTGVRRRSWPLGTYSIHNVPAVRTISFARLLPNLAIKLLRIPAIFGGAAIAGLAYLQYQATRMSYSVK